MYDPQVYDGKNIGRFINQGGLLEGIKALVASCNRDQGGDVYQPKVAENIFNQHANVVYTTRQEMVVTAKQDVRTSSDQAIELLANYGLPYWFAFAVRNHLSLGHDSVLVKGVFWLLFSTFSSMPTTERAKYFPSDTPIPDRIQNEFVNCHCPFPTEQRQRRTRGTTSGESRNTYQFLCQLTLTNLF